MTVVAFVSILWTFMKGDLMKQSKKCPVCDWEIKDDEVKVKVGSKEIIVCCEECAKKVKENPGKYVV
jgi:YHS domain-containing protein